MIFKAIIRIIENNDIKRKGSFMDDDLSSSEKKCTPTIKIYYPVMF